MIAGIFMPTVAREVVKTVVAGVALAEWAVCAVVGIFEKLFEAKRKLWPRVLAVILLIALIWLLLGRVR